MKNAKRIIAVLTCILMMLGSISVTAFADTGCKITIEDPSDSEATVAGKTFNVYKIFNATTDGTNTSYSWYKDSNGNNLYYDFFYGANGVVAVNEANGKVQGAVDYIASLKGNNLDLSKFAENMHAYIVSKGDAISPVKTVTAGDKATSAEVTGLDYGYYMVYDASTISGSAVRSAVMLSNVTKNVTVTLKANRPEIKKQVIDNSGTLAKGTSADIGDTVKFKLETVIPDHNLYKSYTYKIADDLPVGLNLDEDSIKVYKDGNLLIKDTDYTIEKEFDNKQYDFIVALKDVKRNFAAGATVTVEYDAVFSADENCNKDYQNLAYVIYSNDPTNAGENGETFGISSDYANVFTYQLILSKYAADDNNKPTIDRLIGAEFKITKDGKPIYFKGMEIDGVPVYFALANNGDGRTETITTYTGADKTITIDGTSYSIKKGDIVIFGLGEGTYNIEETKAPDGYMLPDQAFELIVTDDIGTHHGAVSVLEATGNHSGDIGSITGAKGDWTVLTVWAEINNRPGSALPDTGGMGTMLFTVLGIAMMAGAASYLIIRRKKSAAN